jgi:cysteine desulfurase / selenocysteine lyase
MDNLKKDFPIFKNRPGMVYLDSAATSQKPKEVIDTVVRWYEYYNSNIHRGIYTLAEEATEIYENSRKIISEFIGAENPEEIIFTGNASEAINLAAYGWGRKFLKKGDVIAISEMEHHSNIIPWMRLKDELGIKLVWMKLNNKYGLDYKDVLTNKKIKLVAVTMASNVLGTVNPIKEMAKWLKMHGSMAKILVDAAQAIPHIPINVRELGCDFLAFSGHKMLGPSGVGVLWARRDLLEVMDPLMVGSHMISRVTKEKATWAEIPDKFETGTGRLEAVAGLGEAVKYINKIGWKKIQKTEEWLNGYMAKEMAKIKGAKVYGYKGSEGRLGVWSFNIDGVHAHDVSEILNRKGICVRVGHHCAQPLMDVLKVPATVRASFYIYNTKEDIDKLMTGINEVKRIFKK